ncbi:bacteriocin [Pseudaeromonas paramecii]|uniref:Bacteriocin n=1 Tax=Pseudaeromonas paramecii TaxID=2138166 RepID=A0ABP8PVX3_9GAMM
MGYGLIDIGAQTRQQAMKGMQASADREQVRESANDQLKAQKKQTTMGAVGTGAAVGSYFGPWGTVAGAAIGFLASELF